MRHTLDITRLLIALLLMSRGHTATRCRHRHDRLKEGPSGATANERDFYHRRNEVLARVRAMYDAGMRALRTHAPNGDERDHGETNFAGIVRHTLMMNSDGEFLYEQLEDGSWVFRCDELTRIYALAAFRSAQIQVDFESARSGWQHWARLYFCVALRARPDVILDLVAKEPLSKAARAIFEQTMQDESGSCYVEGGWRGAERPMWQETSGDWGP
jgi:hypothetical protein